MLQNHKELKVWQMAYKLVLVIYDITGAFPRSEMFGLTSQLRRAALSVVSNITEGYYRKSTKEYVFFLNVAQASCAEVEVQIEVSKDLKYIDDAKFIQLKALTDSICKILRVIQFKLRNSTIPKP